MAADKAPTAAPYSGSLWDAVDALKVRAAEAFDEYSDGSGSLDRLIDDLGQIRDRADSIQTAAIQMAESIRNYL